MRDHVLLQMWGPFRESLIKGHLFYTEQAQKRLLSQFEDMEAEADRAAEEWLEKSGPRFDPDRHDPGDFYEAANDAGIEFYGLLSDMRDQTRLSVVAGMFHEWDKQLRDWLVREIQHWHHGDNVNMQVWSVNFVQMVDLLERFGWDLRSKNYFPALDACRLVVNVYKHGDGKSLDDLKKAYPEYLEDPLAGLREDLSSLQFRDHTNLKVSDDQIQEFSIAIMNFWRDVPENVFSTQVTDVPQWFENAMKKDQGNSQQTSKK
ncbi:hypothetical protein FYA99_14645 [Bordetella parapertussis]|uniref:Uncharacterized protein n=1 Tax=Bordetella parapertussis (strain 12822 / ATCC BAA-587 / NCTC 13253) TaxID=257311 RepID=Q7WAV4_BORPA|nr:hypothetical protein BTL54_06405 [Bordetella parapertussis]AWP63993.1 hypothetical protein B7P06_15650 [Bordetella parapertussis]AWP71496.1 hypothetical protein B7O99_15640 [Bordetella parapertussis]AWP88489.1 hypothetical protein B7P05_06405 [Bordetella parapertussis]AWP95990.1 hypothetical protein B7P09_06410 [Bordetella parapertussis]